MKTTILSLCLITGLSAFGQFKPRAAFDYFPGSYDVKFVQQLPPSSGLNEWETIMSYGSFRVRMGAEYTYKRFGVYFDQHIYMNKASGISFQPLQAEWYCGMKLKVIDKLFIQAEHLCIHPIASDGLFISQTRMYGGYNMISINYGY